MRLICLTFLFLSFGFIGSCHVVEKEPPLSGHALHDFVVYVDSLTLAGATEQVADTTIKYLNGHGPPVTHYDSSQTARLYGYLAYLQFARGDTAAIVGTYTLAGPYMATLDTLTHLRMLRWTSFAYRARGHTGLALTMINRSMRMAELAGYADEYERSRLCWRSLMDSGAVATLRQRWNPAALVGIAIGSGLIFVGIVLMAKARLITTALGSHRAP